MANYTSTHTGAVIDGAVTDVVELISTGLAETLTATNIVLTGNIGDGSNNLNCLSNGTVKFVGPSGVNHIVQIGAPTARFPIFDLQADDVTHGMTGIAPTGVFLRQLLIEDVAGGADITAISEGDKQAMILKAFIGSADPTDTTPAMQFRAGKSDGGTGTAAIGDAETAFQFSEHNGGTDLWTVLGVGDLLPGTTEAIDIGSAAAEVDNIYTQNAVTVSDERRKNFIGPVEASPFLRSLDPQWFTFTDKTIPEKLVRTEEKPITKTVTKSRAVVRVIDGVPTQVIEEYEEQEPVNSEPVQVVDAAGEPVFDVKHVPVITKGGKLGYKTVKTPVMYSKPLTETVEIKSPEKTITHGRPHTGFGAQAIKTAMTAAGFKDWAGYAYDDDADVHMLRLAEFIAFLAAGWQEHDKRLTALEA